MKVITLAEHLHNMVLQGQGELEVYLAGAGGLMQTLKPLGKGETGILNNGVRALVMYPKDEGVTILQPDATIRKLS